MKTLPRVIGFSAMLLLVPLLSSCGILIPLIIGGILDDCHPRGVAFSETALDGVYQGYITDYPTEGERAALELVIEPTYVDRSEYLISGSVVVASQEPLDLDGIVTGGCEYEYAPGGVSSDQLDGQRQPPPPEQLSADARTSAGQLEWSLHGGARHTGWIGPDEISGEMWHEPTSTRHSFVVTRPSE